MFVAFEEEFRDLGLIGVGKPYSARGGVWGCKELRMLVSEGLVKWASKEEVVYVLVVVVAVGAAGGMGEKGCGFTVATCGARRAVPIARWRGGERGCEALAVPALVARVAKKHGIRINPGMEATPLARGEVMALFFGGFLVAGGMLSKPMVATSKACESASVSTGDGGGVKVGLARGRENGADGAVMGTLGGAAWCGGCACVGRLLRAQFLPPLLRKPFLGCLFEGIRAQRCKVINARGWVAEGCQLLLQGANASGPTALLKLKGCQEGAFGQSVIRQSRHPAEVVG